MGLGSFFPPPRPGPGDAPLASLTAAGLVLPRAISLPMLSLPRPGGLQLSLGASLSPASQPLPAIPGVSTGGELILNVTHCLVCQLPFSRGACCPQAGWRYLIQAPTPFPLVGLGPRLALDLLLDETKCSFRMSAGREPCCLCSTVGLCLQAQQPQGDGGILCVSL